MVRRLADCRFQWTLGAVLATMMAGLGVSNGAPGDAYVVAGNFIQELNGKTGAFIDNVTTTGGITGSGDTDLQFGPDKNLYGIGSNGWVYKYNFNTGTKTVFITPTGGMAASGLAFGSDMNGYVDAGSYIQEFNGQTGAFIGNVTTTGGISGDQDPEFQFGPDHNLYGIGSNGWVYEYNFSTGTKTIFVMPTGGYAASALALGPDMNWYLEAGTIIQEYNGQSGAFIKNVTTTGGISGAADSEFQFGPDGNLYGIGTNGWVYEYDFSSGTKTVFAMPNGGYAASGLAFSSVPEPGMLMVLPAAVFCLTARRRTRMRYR